MESFRYSYCELDNDVAHSVPLYSEHGTLHAAKGYHEGLDQLKAGGSFILSY